jgi:CheY-like chemotaxis protein
MAFQRVCQARGTVELALQTKKGTFPLLAEDADRLVLGLSDVDRGQWGLKPGMKLTLKLTDRGLPYEAIVEFQGHGRLEGVEAAHVSLPRLLRCLEEHRLAEVVPDRPVPCVYTTSKNDVFRGQAAAFGEEGLELGPQDDRVPLYDQMRVKFQTHLELFIEKDRSLVLPAEVAYYGEKLWGLLFTKTADPLVIGQYRQWLLELWRKQMQLDRSRFDTGGSKAPAKEAEEAPRLGTQATVLVDKDPMLMVLSEGDAFPKRLAEGVGRKFGVASLDYVKGPVKPALQSLGADASGWGRARMILLHRMRTASPLEVAKQLTTTEACPLPVLVVGTEEDESVKRNRAIASGAVDYLSVDPFHVLKVLKALDDTLKMFG